MNWRRQNGEDLLLFLRIQPRASKDVFGEIVDNQRKLHIQAPPVDGKTNAYIIKYLAKMFGITKSRVVVESGFNSRNKRICIQACSALPEHLLEP